MNKAIVYFLEVRMEKYLQEVGARVKEARMRKHLSQAQLADLLGLTPPYISNIETGKQNMSITALAKISDVLEVSADWLLRNNTADALAITVNEVVEDVPGIDLYFGQRGHDAVNAEGLIPQLTGSDAGGGRTAGRTLCTHILQILAHHEAVGAIRGSHLIPGRVAGRKHNDLAAIFVGGQNLAGGRCGDT